MQRAPVLYQDGAGGRQAVAGRFTLDGDGQVSFVVGAYDSGRPLVIDPVLAYSTYLGGGGRGSDAGFRHRRRRGRQRVRRRAGHLDRFPDDPGRLPAGHRGGSSFDAFVAKLDPTGTSLIYSTYLGGDGQDQVNGIAIDAAGNAYVTGIHGLDGLPHHAGRVADRQTPAGSTPLSRN